MGRTNVFNKHESINMTHFQQPWLNHGRSEFQCALSTTINKSREVRFSIWFLQTVHHRFANATHLQKHKSDQRKTKNKGEQTEQHPHTFLLEVVVDLLMDHSETNDTAQLRSLAILLTFFGRLVKEILGSARLSPSAGPSKPAEWLSQSSSYSCHHFFHYSIFALLSLLRLSRDPWKLMRPGYTIYVYM